MVLHQAHMAKRKTKYGFEAGRSHTLKEFNAIIREQTKKAKVKGLNRRPETELLLAFKLRVINAALETDDIVNLLEGYDSLRGEILGKAATKEDKAYWEWRQTYRGKMPKKKGRG